MEDVARTVHSYIDQIRTEGSVWGGTTERAILHLFAGTRAEQLFGHVGLTAAATKTVHACCRFGLTRLLAIVLDEPKPTISPGMVALLGKPCASCLTQIAAEHKAAHDVPTGREQPPRPVGASSLTAGGGPTWHPGGPSSPDGWTVRVSRTPTPEEDETFLEQMARQDAERRR